MKRVDVDGWCPIEDGRPGAALFPRETAQARTTTLLVVLTDPAPAVARLTIVQQWGGDWITKQGRVWPDPDAEGM